MVVCGMALKEMQSGITRGLPTTAPGKAERKRGASKEVLTF